MMYEADFVKEKTCCFAGHRSRDLPFGGDMDTYGMKILKSVICFEILQAVSAGYDTFITGMSDGVDMICAESVHEMICAGKALRLFCAIPYAGQGSEMKSARAAYLYGIITSRYPAMVLREHYVTGCYKERNQFMVDNSSRLIAVCKHKDSGSGTMQTINLARRAGLDCRVIDLDSNPHFYLDYTE